MTDPKYDRDRLCGDDVTLQEQERLVRLMEEAGEVIQACAKTLRWGWASVNPTLPSEEQETNRAYLRREVGDLIALAARLDVQPLAVGSPPPPMRPEDLTALYGWVQRAGPVTTGSYRRFKELHAWAMRRQVREESND